MKPRGAAYDWEFRWRLPILIASQPVLAWLARASSGSPRAWYAPEFAGGVAALAVVISTLGILLRIQATTALRARVMASDNPDVSRFVTHGLYRALRNPLYVSSLLLFGGYALFFGWGWAVGFVAFHAWRYQRLVRLEESLLRNEWGAEFDEYCRAVPRWWPKWPELRFEFGRWLSWHGVVANWLYVATWCGIVVSAWQGNLVWIIPFESAGGLLMAGYYANRWARRVSMPGPEPVPLISELTATARRSSQSRSLDVVPVPHFETDSFERVSAAMLWDKASSAQPGATSAGD